MKGVIYCQIATPTSGVELTGGVLKRVFDNNIQYLLNIYSVEEILYRFRERAGDPHPPGHITGWEDHLYGSLAGLFLMGGGNALRWVDNGNLRDKMNQVIDGIDKCKQSNGFMMAYKETDTAKGENPNYVRYWVTLGLIEASIAGNEKALSLIRGYQDWFNQCNYLPLVKEGLVGYIGMLPNTRMYFTSMGKKEDIEVAQKFYQEDWWLDQLIKSDDTAIYKRKGVPPHSYEITAFEAYLDLYRATGASKYLDAIKNAWNMIHDKWEHIGGSIAICEDLHKEYPPYSYYIKPEHHTGELCGSILWIKFNQRLHLLYPNEEKYVNEIEKSIYNVGIANQVENVGLRYHAFIQKRKDITHQHVTCCEGQGTRLFGSLPEYLYSIAPDGLYVDMYSASKITSKQGGGVVTLTTCTSFPENGDITMSISTTHPRLFKLRLRIPSWLTTNVEINVNGSYVATGIPSTYCTINKTWNDSDTISFTLPMDFKVTKYVGYDKFQLAHVEYDRYSVEYGPILLAVVGPFDFYDSIMIVNNPANPKSWLIPIECKPLHFAIKDKSGFECMPYYEIQDQCFTCYPIISIEGNLNRPIEMFYPSTEWMYGKVK